jgi:hypothetical protein
MEETQVEMWNDMENTEENQVEIIQLTFLPYFPFLLTIQLGFIP